MKGYKAFFKKGKDYYTGGLNGSIETKWKIGETKSIDGEINLCLRGFHYFAERNFCFAFGFFNSNTKICEVEILGKIKSDAYKCVTNKIKIIKDVTKKLRKFVDDKTNSGQYNSGYCNSGDYNSGQYNSGYCNSGDYNSGHYNSGRSNSGRSNSGRCNSGDHNSGNYNSGNYNSGHYNSGCYNIGHCNSGVFNTNEPYMRAFNKQTKIKYSNWINSENYICFNLNLKNKTNKEAWLEWWDKNKSLEMVEKIKKFPNFNAKIFEEITGIKL